jgi:hypothetical protein
VRICTNHLVPYLGPLIVLATAAMAKAQEGATGKENASQSQPDMLLAAMRAQAERFTVAQTVNGKMEEVPLRADPVFRYTDQPRGYVDATLWCWGMKGRPIVLTKVEAYVPHRVGTRALWQYCVVSLAEHPVEVRFLGQQKLVVNKAGVELHALEKAPVSADRPAMRLRQMKQIAARFAGTIHIDGNPKDKQEMRRLPTPIYRYDDETDGLRDGVIFALTTNGTNPDMLILIELRGEREAAPKWHYGIAKVTYAEVHIRLDDTEILSSPLTAPRETWTFFQMPRQR